MTFTNPARIDPDTIEIRVPEGAERRACRMLLPELEQCPHWSDFRIAVRTAPMQILGAAAFAPAMESTGARHHAILLRVARPFRLQGIGSHLLHHLEAEARDQNAAALSITYNAQAEPETSRFLQAHSFELVDRFITFETETQTLFDQLIPLRDWLRERGDIPESARMVPLIEADLEKVARLHVDNLGGTIDGVLAHLKHLIKQPTHYHNIVLLVNDQPEGFILGETRDGVSQIHARVVSQAYQGSAFNTGWANVFLMAECHGLAVKHNSCRSRFSCLSTNSHTVKLAARGKAETVSSKEVHRRPLT